MVYEDKHTEEKSTKANMVAERCLSGLLKGSQVFIAGPGCNEWSSAGRPSSAKSSAEWPYFCSALTPPTDTKTKSQAVQ